MQRLLGLADGEADTLRRVVEEGGWKIGQEEKGEWRAALAGRAGCLAGGGAEVAEVVPGSSSWVWHGSADRPPRLLTAVPAAPAPTRPAAEEAAFF